MVDDVLRIAGGARGVMEGNRLPLVAWHGPGSVVAGDIQHYALHHLKAQANESKSAMVGSQERKVPRVQFCDWIANADNTDEPLSLVEIDDPLFIAQIAACVRLCTRILRKIALR
jgi:hypothetical protein